MYRGLVSGKEQKYRDNGLRKIFISKVEESFEGLNNTAPFSSLRIFFIFSNNGGEEQSFQHLHFKQFFNRLINLKRNVFLVFGSNVCAYKNLHLKTVFHNGTCSFVAQALL